MNLRPDSPETAATGSRPPEQELAEAIHLALVERRRSDPRGHEDMLSAIVAEVEEQAGILSGQAREALVERVMREASGLGPLEVLLEDESVQEVMVIGGGQVFVERGGRIEEVPVCFEDENQLRNTIERILAPLGRRVDELSPMADARLPDGSRVNVVIPPLAVDGPAVSIRRFPASRPDPEALVTLGTLTRSQAERLEQAVRERRSILISGGTGSGKTTLLNALASFIDPTERIVTIEDAAELHLGQPHVR